MIISIYEHTNKINNINSLVHVFDAAACLYHFISNISLPSENQAFLFPNGCIVSCVDFPRELLCGKDHWEWIGPADAAVTLESFKKHDEVETISGKRLMEQLL